MSFESPLQLAWLALIVPVVLLYLRYVGRQTEEASTLAIWKHALAQRTLWSRWRRTVSILAACVPVVLVALALARPEFTAAKTAPRSMAVVIDNTASMNATDVRPSRLGQAKRAAHRLIARLRTGETMAIISADAFTHAHCGLTDDRRVLGAALGQVQPTDGAGDLSLAIATAQRLLAGHANPVLVVLTDKVDDSLRASMETRGASSPLSRANIVVQQFGGPASNAAITQLASRPAPGGGATQEVFIEVSNFSAAARDVAIEIGLAGQPPQKVVLNVSANGKAQRVLPMRVENAGLLTAKLAAPDDLAADNVATLLVLPTAKLRVGFAENGATASPLSIALASISGVEVVAGSATAKTDVEIVSETAPAKLPPRPTLVIAPTESSDAWQVIGELEAPLVAMQTDHPLVAGVDLRRVVIDRGVKLKLGGDAQVLAATAAGDPLLAIVPRETGDVIVLAFLPQASDLALRGDFPRLLTNSLALLGQSSALGGSSWTTTELLIDPQAPPDTRLVSPFGSATTASAEQPLAAALVQAGVWQIESTAGAAALPVNLISRDESNLTFTKSDLPSRVPAPLLPDVGPLWRWLVGLAVIWVLGQWVFYQRREID